MLATLTQYTYVRVARNPPWYGLIYNYIMTVYTYEPVVSHTGQLNPFMAIGAVRTAAITLEKDPNYVTT